MKEIRVDQSGFRIFNFVCALYKCGMMVVYKKLNNLKNKHSLIKIGRHLDIQLFVLSNV